MPSTKSSTENIKVNNFTTVTRKRSKRSVRGKNTNTILTAVENRKWIFASNFVSITIENYIKERLKSYAIPTDQCQKLPIKNTSIATFKIAGNENCVERLFSEELWPKNAMIRYYKNFQRPYIP